MKIKKVLEMKGVIENALGDRNGRNSGMGLGCEGGAGLGEGPREGDEKTHSYGTALHS